MSRIIAWFVHNPIAANLLMVVMVAGGLLALPLIHQEEFPAIETDLVRISIEYPSATPSEIEQSICVRVEEEIEGTPGIDRLNSLAVEGACVITVELVMGSKTDAILSDIDNKVQSIDTLPEEAERPVVSKVLMRSHVLNVVASGDVDEAVLKIVGQRAREEIAALEGVSQVNLKYTRPYELSLEVSEEALRRHGLSFDQVAAAVRDFSLDLPGGSVRTAGGEILLRTVGQAYEGHEFEDIAVLTRTDGTTVTLGQIATVVDGFEDVDLRARFNGKRAVLINIERIGDEDILEIAETVKAWIPGFQATLPEGIDITVYADDSEELISRLDALLGNARSGLILVLLILTLFLRFRLAMWVAAGVPISLLGAIMFFPTFGFSISTLTVMAFILVLGILVDDAIVIGESVHRHEQAGENQIEAAINGTHEVYVPVIFGVMTTVAAFIPLIIVPGHMGRFFSYIGYTAILCLVFSLIESQLVLPSHLAHRRISHKRGEPNAFVARWLRFQKFMAGGLERFAKQRYGESLKKVIEYRYVAAAVAIGVLILTSALFSSGRMRYQFFPAVDGDIIFATLTMPQGIPLVSTEAAVAQLHAAAEKVRAELDTDRGDGPSAVVHTLSSIGEQLGRNGPGDLSVNTGGAHLAEIAMELLPQRERGGDSSTQIAKRWRELTGAIPDAVELAFSTQSFSAGEALNIELRGGDVETLTQAALALRQQLASYGGVSDVADSFRAGKQEVQLSLRDEARTLGLSLSDMARQVRQAFYGEEVQRIQRGRDDVRVMVRYPEADRRTLGSLEQMRIRTRDGVEVPFVAIADAKLDRGFATIRRTDRARVVTVTGEVDRTITTPEKILADIQRELPALLSSFPGVTWRLGGEQREHGDAAAGLGRGAVLGLMMIYALLAIPLKSYLQPLIIMSVIPFGAAGAIVGHLIMGWDLVFFSILGIVALSGVVVNASLMLVHNVNRQRAQGISFIEAVSTAGIVRFRPIALTSVTTYIGLLPLMFEPDVAARPLIPMAISLGYGVLMASVVTLFLVPCGYVILDDLQRLFGKGAVDRITAEPEESGAAIPDSV
jgi:multidrug efflux pump subunit AcrB